MVRAARSTYAAWCRLGEEVEYGSVVPGVVGARGFPRQDVADDVGDPPFRGAEPFARHCERFAGDVEHGDVVATVGQERVGEPGRAGSDVDHRAALLAQELHGVGWRLFEPRHRVEVSRREDSIPVVRAVVVHRKAHPLPTPSRR